MEERIIFVSFFPFPKIYMQCTLIQKVLREAIQTKSATFEVNRETKKLFVNKKHILNSQQKFVSL